MSSPLSDAVKRAAEENAEEIAGKIAARLNSALGVVQGQVESKLNEVIQVNMNDYYYSGYTPTSYRRTGIVRNNLTKPVIRSFASGGKKGFTFGVRYEPENMHHINRGKHPTKPDEYLIAENFSEGIHPRPAIYGGDVSQGTIWSMSSPEGSAADIVREWAKENLNKAFADALSGLMK